MKAIKVIFAIFVAIVVGSCIFGGNDKKPVQKDPNAWMTEDHSVEAYVMTPRIMTKAVSIPGALVLISAMAGAALLGLLGALIAVPVTASILMVINEVVVPRQDAKVDAEA